MIITITGKPCSGKGTVAKEFCKLYNFEYICTGDMFRAYAKQFGYDNILKFQEQDPRIKQIDKLVDDGTVDIGKTRAKENIVIDSRMAWHFVPNSFKVFIDVKDEVAGERLLGANRETEKSRTLEDAIESLKSRWNVENSRYMELYNVNNLNLNNYDYVIDSSNLTPSEVVEKIYKNYQKFIENIKNI
ncbi:MAG: nucleoside monophosphate kinase [Clostridia bacterium]|nr:nucleoside monophosphate kinase [Clostridia bacterium]